MNNKLVLDEEMAEYFFLLVREDQVRLDQQKCALIKRSKEWTDREELSCRAVARCLMGSDDE